ncbi:unnamed protein product [Lepidochelys olivacea]
MERTREESAGGQQRGPQCPIDRLILRKSHVLGRFPAPQMTPETIITGPRAIVTEHGQDPCHPRSPPHRHNPDLYKSPPLTPRAAFTLLHELGKPTGTQVS